MTDAPFHLILVIGFVLVIAVAFYHRLRAASGERLDRRQEGLFVMVALRAAGAALWVGVIAYMISPASMAWSALALPAWLRWTGAVLWILVAGLLTWTLRSLGPNLTDTVVTRQTHTLVLRGPYRWVRHPFYVSVALLIVASSLTAANWFIFVAGACVLMFLFVRTSVEEANLVARFGDAYRDYMRQTGRFIPRRRAR